MAKITPFLWFDNQAEEAAKFYTSVFKNSKILTVTHYSQAGAQASGQPKGATMTVVFQLDGQEFVALNGGPHAKFTEAVSFVVNCKNLEELDYYCEKLSAGGDQTAQQCGWLKDKYGLSWQVVPADIEEMLEDKEPKKAERVMAAVLQMKKLDIETLKRAHDQDDGQ